MVIWAPGMDPSVVAGLASTRTFPLRSSFRPSYNMAVNLVSSFGRARAQELLGSSFAQFQADRSVVGLARAAARHEQDAERFAAEMHSDRGDVGAYAQIRRRSPTGRRTSPATRRPSGAWRPPTPSAHCAPVTSSACRRDGGRGWPSCSTRVSPTSPTRIRWC